MTNGTYC